MEFTDEEKGIAHFLNSYLSKNHGASITVTLADENNIFCATNFNGKKLVEMGVELIKIGISETKVSEE